MLNRRHLLLTIATSVLIASPAFAQATAPADPAAFITAIYARAVKGDGGGFISDSKADKARYLSKALAALWIKAEAHAKDDVGPIDFDPVSNSQDPDIGPFKATVEKSEADKASVAVAFKGKRVERKNYTDTVRYDLVREAGQWKIDDIRGTIDKQEWSVRKLLADSLKR